MKTVQKQYKNSTETSNNLLAAGKGFLQNFYLMAIPILFLFVTSCGKQEAIDTTISNATIETRGVCDQFDCLGPLNTYTKDFIINGCVVTATYTVNECLDRTRIYNMSYTFANSATCNSTKQIWNQYYLNGQSLLANEAINVFYNEITLLIEANYISTLTPDKYPPLLQWIETKCHTLCAVEVKFEDLPSYYDLSQVQCGTSCCVRETDLLVVDGKVVKGPSEIVQLGGCDPVTIKCKGEMLLGCKAACERLK